MNVVDSSGWLEYFADGPNAGKFAPPLEDRTSLVVPSITIYEVFKVVCRQRGEDAALQAAALMQQGAVVELAPSLAMIAAKTSLEFSLPMADSIILATARLYGAQLWTQDEHFSGLPDVQYFPR
ncbi:type II toxin-antitoxin system VapC family toxin [Geomobilimonas luticola]|uniref:Ribonuclease VapC n=1 Tax=Geomobilimonas luticola TaxID=1114878 RepID=A0ABS5SCN0_9BACT|nr:type II toxin-antitoxin system VapC family toxin [Geomobilimonas luticola]MBT0653136.1 type II toxin-antitoxin system VapC family toxin [Geomobilimonas luticola]